MVAALTRSFGPAHLSLAEEVVQESLIEALRRWPFHGTPQEPAAWLFSVARNRALDRLRRDTSFRGKEAEIRRTLMAQVPEPTALRESVLATCTGLPSRILIIPSVITTSPSRRPATTSTVPY